MLFAGWEAFVQAVFGVVYVMTEQSNQHSKANKISLLRCSALFLLDAGQVLRSLIVKEFGWSQEIPQPPITSLVFFIVAVAMVVVSIADSVIVVRIFQSGKTTQLWPVVILRFLVATMVTTFFITIMRSLLFPFQCTGITLNQILEGPDVPCRPWSAAAAGISGVALILAGAFAVFSIAVTLLRLEVNPLGQIAGDFCTGRVEAMWSFIRVLLCFLVYLQRYITPMAALVLVSIPVLCVNLAHFQLLPFHHHVLNLLRGGIYLVTLWFVVASLITSSSPQQDPAREWSMIALAPLLFMLGVFLTQYKKMKVGENVKRLRFEFLKECEGSHCGHTIGRGSFVARMGESCLGLRPPPPASSSHPYIRRNVRTSFFSGDGKQIRTFSSASSARLTIRTLLYEKDERDLTLMANLLRRAQEEHPESKDIILMTFVYHRFVFMDTQAATWFEKMSQMNSTDWPIDLKYSLYAVKRKAFQHDAGATLGKESISAINLMEFSSKMAHARKRHQECLTLTKSLWKTAIKCKKQPTPSLVADLIESFTASLKVIENTHMCYENLMEKFSGSSSLRMDFANFCDVVLNNAALAEQHRVGSELLEFDDDAKFDERKMNGSATYSSCPTSFRNSQQEFVKLWREGVMIHEQKSLHRLNRVVVGLGLLLMLVSSIGFLVNSYYLYLTVMKQRLAFLERAKGIRINLFRSCFEIRNMHLAAHGFANMFGTVPEVGQRLNAIAQQLGSLHTLNYVSSPSAAISNFLLKEDILVEKSYPGVEQLVKVNISFWELGKTYVQAINGAASIVGDEMLDASFLIGRLGIANRSMLFMFENLIPYVNAVSKFLDLIIFEIKNVENLTNLICLSLLSIEALLIVAISFVVIRDVSSVFPTCQLGSVGSKLVDHLPLPVLKKILKYYVSSERSLVVIDDEDAARQDVIQASHDEAEQGPFNSNKHMVMMNGDDLQSIAYATSKAYGECQPIIGRTCSATRNHKLSDECDADENLINFSHNGRSMHDKTSESIQLENDYKSEYERGQDSSPHASFRSETKGDAASLGGFLHLYESRLQSPRAINSDREQGIIISSLPLTPTNLCSHTSRGTISESRCNEYEQPTNPRDCLQSGSGTTEIRRPSPPLFRTRPPVNVVNPVVVERTTIVEAKSTTLHFTGTRRPQQVMSIGQCPSSSQSELSLESGLRRSSILKVPMIRPEASIASVDMLLIDSGVKRIKPFQGIRRERKNSENSFRHNSKWSAPNSSYGELDVMGMDKEILKATLHSLPWYFQPRVYKAACVLIFVVCFCLWLVPIRLVPDMINVSLLVRQTRAAGGYAMESIFLARELVLADGLSRLSEAEIWNTFKASTWSFLEAINMFRLGGPAVNRGADSIPSIAMDAYRTGMYQRGCPWRLNESSCDLPGGSEMASHGLYELLLQFHGALDLLVVKYGLQNQVAWPSNFTWIVPRPDRINKLVSDPDLAIVQQKYYEDVMSGLEWAEQRFYIEQKNLLEQMKTESDGFLSLYVIMVVGLFYLVLFRHSVSSARGEVLRTRFFVSTLPVHVLTREETEYIRDFFVGSVDDELDERR